MMMASRSASTMALAFLGILTACGRPASRSDTVVIASGADLESANPLTTLHPLARQVQRYALFVTLFRYDNALSPQPYFARAWSWSPDRRQLALSLAGEVRWHDGHPTTAHDVKFTFDAIRDPATGSPRFAEMSDVERLDVTGDRGLTMVFSRPQAAIPAILSEQPIAPAHLLGDVAAPGLRQAPFGHDPVGNGPFRFVRRRPGQLWEFARHDGFPESLGGPPDVARLVVAVVDEAATKFAGLVSQDLDMAGISPSMAELAARDPALRVVDYPVLVSYGIVFNTHRPPFDDVRVRRAISLAINRPRVIQSALAGFAVPAFGPVPPDHPYAAPADRGFDRGVAAALLDGAGWRQSPDGMRRRHGAMLEFELLTVGSADNAAEQLIQADLATLGIRLEIRQREMGAFLAAARAPTKTFDALFTGVPGDLALAYLSSLFDSRLAGGTLDYGAFHRPGIDSALARARRAPDDAARVAWADVQRLLEREMPVAWVYHARGVQGIARRLENVHMDLRGELVSLVHWKLAS